MKESVAVFLIKIVGAFVRFLPIALALSFGKLIGMIAYYFDIKHRSQAYANLKLAFAQTKSPQEIKQITKQLFKNYGQNLIELLRMPLMSKTNFEKFVHIEGKEHVENALKQGNGVILLAMHFGSWEMASLTCAMLGFPYKMIVKPQNKYSKLDELLNSYRACGGSVILSRGIGTRDLIKGLKNNEVIGMVVDQGGRDGVLVPFLGREASMSVGAIRMGLKLNVPLCFSVIIRDKGAKHRVVIQEPFELENSGDQEKDVVANLQKIVQQMEHYIKEYPSEYMWFYKIWKYSKETKLLILSDGKTGHVRQSQVVAQMTQKALAERGITSNVETVQVQFKSTLRYRLFSVFSRFYNHFIFQGRFSFLKWFLTVDSYKHISSTKADFVISCGSSTAGINNFLSQDFNAKSIVLQRPGLLSSKRFDLVILPRHDVKKKKTLPLEIVTTRATPNLITDDYLKEQSRLLLNRYSHLKNRTRMKIGLLIGGDGRHVILTEAQIKILVNQLREVAGGLNADILITTSRRTLPRLEQIILKGFKSFDHCPLLIVANRENIPEAVGGILGLSDVLVISGDSISMISEAASSGKKTVVFMPHGRELVLADPVKHKRIIESLSEEGFIYACDVRDLASRIYDLTKNKIQLRRLDDQSTIFEAVKKVI